MDSFIQRTAEHNGSEKRYLPRWRVSSRVTYLLGDGTPLQLAKTKDINCAGTCLLANAPIDVDQTLELTIHLSEYEHLRVKGRVVWTKAENGARQIGILFDGTTDEQQKMILDQAYSINKKEVVNHWFKGWD